MFERDYAVRHRKRAFDIGRLSQGFIVIQKQVWISRRSRSRNWIIAHSSPVCATLLTDVIQMPASAVTRQPQITRSRAPRRAVRRKELAARGATTDLKHRTRRARGKRKTYADSRSTGSCMGLASVFENHARLATQPGRSLDYVIAAPMATRCTRRYVASVRPMVRHASGLRKGPVFVRDNIRDIKGRIVWCVRYTGFLSSSGSKYPLVRPSYGSRLYLTITRPSAFAAKKSNQS